MLGDKREMNIDEMKDRIARAEEIQRYTENRCEALEKEKCELLGIIQGKDTAIQNLQKENLELKDANEKIVHLACNQDKDLVRKLTEAKDIINCLVHLGEFNENTDEEYLNYQVHDVLKQAEQFLEETDECICFAEGDEIA